nr:hypothetical protein [Tanacetum cinerariifolium]
MQEAENCATSTTEAEYVAAPSGCGQVLWIQNQLLDNRTVPLFPSMLVTMGEGSGTSTEPHHTPTPEATPSLQHELSSSSLPSITTEPLPTATPSDTPQLRQYTRRARIAQSSTLLTATDEPASPLGDGSQGEACPTVTGFVAGQDMANITKTSTLPSDSTSRQHTEMASKIEAQELEISNLKAMVKLLEDREGGGIAQSRDDALIKRRSLDEREGGGIAQSRDDALIKRRSLDESGSIPTVGPPATGVPTGSDVVPTASPIFTTATESIPYTRRKGKEKMVESKTPKKKKLQEQIYVQVARELEEEMERDAQRMN